MSRLSQSFTDADRERINRAVSAAEGKADVEIVPVVAWESGRYDRAEDLLGLWTAVIVLSVVWLLLPRPAHEPGHWDSAPEWAHLFALVAAVVGGFIVGVVIGARIDGLRLLFTPAKQKSDEVFARARQVFFDHRVHHTTAGSGLLLYVSLLERVAVVLGDQQVVAKLGQSALDELCAELTRRLHDVSPTDALVDIIQRTGDRLGAVLPRTGAAVDQLPNALVLVEP